MQEVDCYILCTKTKPPDVDGIMCILESEIPDTGWLTYIAPANFKRVAVEFDRLGLESVQPVLFTILKINKDTKVL
jgi:hypothetical protein